MIRIEFIKGYRLNTQWQVIGSKVSADDSLAKDLILKGIAKEYKGPWPPKSKTKTNLFKPKIKWQ